MSTFFPFYYLGKLLLVYNENKLMEYDYDRNY